MRDTPNHFKVGYWNTHLLLECAHQTKGAGFWKGHLVGTLLGRGQWCPEQGCSARQQVCGALRCEGVKLSHMGAFPDFLLPRLPRTFCYCCWLTTGPRPPPHAGWEKEWGTLPAGGARKGLGRCWSIHLEREGERGSKYIKGYLEDLEIREIGKVLYTKSSLLCFRRWG